MPGQGLYHAARAQLSAVLLAMLLVFGPSTGEHHLEARPAAFVAPIDRVDCGSLDRRAGIQPGMRQRPDRLPRICLRLVFGLNTQHLLKYLLHGISQFVPTTMMHDEGVMGWEDGDMTTQKGKHWLLHISSSVI